LFQIHILRIKCEPLAQADFLKSPSNSATIITKSIRAKPTSIVGRGSEWHVGNIDLIDPHGIAFAMGRTTAVTTPRFDSSSRDFIEEEVMRAPYTIGIFDQETQACGIIKKSGVSQSAREIANKLEILLNSTQIPSDANMSISVDPLWNPSSFIDAIRTADEIVKFSFTASRPNPADVNRLIQRPAEEFTQEVGGEKTTVSVEGENLEKGILEEVTKAVAAVGEDASASIREEPGKRAKRFHLAGNTLTDEVEAETQSSLLEQMLNVTKRAYHSVRERLE
jgi:hypothetical protein